MLKIKRTNRVTNKSDLQRLNRILEIVNTIKPKNRIPVT